MPLYEYQCRTCGNVFEVMQKFSEAPLTVHEGCGGAVVRLLSPPGLQFKGSGWYITDYARKNGKESAAGKGKDSESSPKSETMADSKTKSAGDTAQAAKSEAK